MPRLDKKIRSVVDPTDVRRMLDDCQRLQEKTIILSPLNTGAGASEFCTLDSADLRMRSGALAIRLGGVSKDLAAFLGAKSRKSLLRYLAGRGDLPEG
jgi:site-specific recombinase XerD